MCKISTINENSEKKRAVVFDMDGVIFDSEQLCLKCWKKLADKYHIEKIEELFLKCIGTTREVTKRIMIDYYESELEYDAFAKEASEMFHEYSDRYGLPLKKGVREILEYLQKNDYLIALASSTRFKTVEAELKAAGIYNLFHIVIGGDLVKRSKPAPDIYINACEYLRVKPENAYAIEDSYNGVRSAYKAGMRVIMVPDLIMPDDEMKEKTFKIVEDLTKVIELFA